MDVSPITPTSGPVHQQLDLPATPIISPSLHLPRLITSFQNSASNASNLRRMSVQFQLLTPSPLSLGKTPVTAVPRRGSAPMHRRTDAVSLESSLRRESSAKETRSPPTPYSGLSPVTPTACRRVPSLKRQNAMEGLDKMNGELGSPILRRVVQLPLRVNTRSSFDSASSVSDSEDEIVEAISSHIVNATPRKYRRILPKTQLNAVSSSRHGAVTDTSQIKSRSPIQKKQHHRRRSSQRLSSPAKSRRPTPEDIELSNRISHLASQLVPLISVRTGLPHPLFPRSLLQYHLLTHDQLDALARHYHQTLDAGEERWMYPCPIPFGKSWCGSSPPAMSSHATNELERRHLVDLETRRRRWGRFIGLKGCESPVVDGPQSVREAGETLMERFEREWREALRRAEEEHKIREKLWGRRF